MKLVVILLLLVVVLVFSGCTTQQSSTGSTNQTPEVKEFKVKISHSGYLFYLNNRPVLTPSVSLGDTVRFLATSQTDEQDHGHGITIDEYKINEAVKKANEKEPVVVEFVADKTGKFKIWCKTCEEGIFGSDHPEIEAVFEVK